MAPQMPMGMAAGGMVAPYASGGGLGDLPIADTMFDEPSNGGFNDGYAGGGLVAFANGGSAYGPWFEEQATRAIPGIGVSSRIRTAARNAQVGGAPNSYHLTDDARDFVPPKGMDSRSLAQKLKSLYGAGFDVINEGDHVHVEPGPKSARMTKSTPRNANVSTPQGRAVSLDDSMMLGQQMLADLPREGLDRARSVALEDLTPEKQEHERKQDMWQALAQMGFRLASSNSPFLLQAIGEAAAATLPEVQASKRERRAIKNEAIKTLMAVEDVDRKTATAGVELGMEVYKSGLTQEQFDKRMGLEERQLSQQAQLAREEMRNRKDVAETAAEVRMDKGLERLTKMFEIKMRDDAAAGRWKTPSGGKPSETDIKYWAAVNAYAEWKKYNQTQQAQGGGNSFPPPGGGGQQPGPWTQYQQ